MLDSRQNILVLGLIGLGCSLALFVVQSGPAARAQEMSLAHSASEGKRLREGSTINDQLGRFEMRGDRIVFCPENTEQSYCCLENLNLARVYKAVTETPDELQWVVSGTLTEFNNVNYLLLSRVARKAQPERR